MPTENEIRVLNMLSAVDYGPDSDPGKLIESWGTEAVTVACEVALGTYPGLSRKMRTNAVAFLETIEHPQAQETVRMLVKDPDSDVSIRAIRAAAGQQNTSTVKEMATLLRSTTLQPLVAVEIVKALSTLDTPEARETLRSYQAADPERFPHRAYQLVNEYLDRSTK
jgi:hypothetical protein